MGKEVSPFSSAGNNQMHIDHFGSLRTATLNVVVQGNFPGPVLDINVWTATITGSGSSLLPEDGTGILSTGTDSTGGVKLISVRPGVFQAGSVTQYQSGVRAGAPVAGNIRRWGLISLDETHGLFFELNGTAFRVVARNSGTDTVVEQANFSADTSFTPGDTNTTYRIKYSAGRAEFYRASGGNIVLLHEMVDTAKPLAGNLDLHLYYENINAGNTTNVDFILRGASTGVLGNLEDTEELAAINLDKLFAPGEVETTDWAFVGDFKQVHILAETDTVGFGELEWSDDGISVKRIREVASSVLVSPDVDPLGINVSIYEVPYGKWLRARWTQSTTTAGNVHFRALGVRGASALPVTQVAFPYDRSDHVIATKASIVRRDPTGTYVDERQGGVHPDLSTDTPLVADGVFRSDWVEVQGFAEVSSTLKTDQPSAVDGAVLQFARDIFDPINIENITQADPAVVTITGHGIPDGEEVLITGVVGMTQVNQRYFMINVLDADSFELVGEDSTGHTAYSSGGAVEQVRITRQVIESVDIPVAGSTVDPFAATSIQDAFVRIQYTNGPVAQGVFNLHTQITDVPHAGDIRIVGSQEMEFSSPAQYTKALTYAHPSALEKPIPVFQDSTTRGQYSHIVGHDTATPVRPPKSLTVGQLNANSLAASQIILDPAAEVVGIKNIDANENIFVGFTSTVTSNTGWLISPLLGDSFPVRPADGDELWVISGSPVASTSTANRFPATITNNGAVDPNNALTNNNMFAVLDDQGDSIDADGFTAAGVFTDISKVQLGMRARKSSTTTVTISHVATVTGTAIGAPAVSSGTVTSVAGDKYLAAVTWVDTSVTLDSIVGLGLTWTPVVGEVSDSNNFRTAVWQATGTPTGNSVVTASFSAAAGDSVIAVSSYRSIDLSTPIETSGTNKQPVANINVTGSINGDTFGDFIYAAIGTNRRTATPGTGYTERADAGTGTGPNDARIVVQDRSVVTPGSQSVTATLDGASNWVVCMVSLNIGPGTAPTVTLSHDLGGTTLVQELDGTNTDYLVDVTADRAWNATDIGNVVVTVEATTEVDTDAEIDSIFLEVTEIDEGGLVRVSFIQFGDSVT